MAKLVPSPFSFPQETTIDWLKIVFVCTCFSVCGVCLCVCVCVFMYVPVCVCVCVCMHVLCVCCKVQNAELNKYCAERPHSR